MSNVSTMINLARNIKIAVTSKHIKILCFLHLCFFYKTDTNIDAKFTLILTLVFSTKNLLKLVNSQKNKKMQEILHFT